MLAREGDTLVAGSRFTELRRIYDYLVAGNLLHSERMTLLELSHTGVNKTLLHGT